MDESESREVARMLRALETTFGWQFPSGYDPQAPWGRSGMGG